MKYLELFPCSECKHQTDIITVGEKRHVHYCFCTIKQKTFRACAPRKCKLFEKAETFYKEQEMQNLETKLMAYLLVSEYSDEYQKMVLCFFKYSLAQRLSVLELKTSDAETLYEHIKETTRRPRTVCITLIKKVQQLALDKPIDPERLQLKTNKKFVQCIEESAYCDTYKKEIINFYQKVLLKYLKFYAIKTLSVEKIYAVVEGNTLYKKEWCLTAIQRVKDFLMYGTVDD